MSCGRMLLLGLALAMLGAAPGGAAGTFLTLDGTLALGGDPAAFAALGISEGDPVRFHFKLKRKDRNKADGVGQYKIKRYEVRIGDDKLSIKTKASDLTLDSGANALVLQVRTFSSPSGRVNKNKAALQLLSVSGDLLQGSAMALAGLGVDKLPVGGLMLGDFDTTSLGTFQFVLDPDGPTPMVDVNLSGLQLTKGRPPLMEPTPIPEPGTAALMALGLGALGRLGARHRG
jgi:hypothetical protein